MPQGHVLEFSGVTKRFGALTAVSDFTATVQPGIVTGFLGPNGAGKSTTLRMLLGLMRPTSGSATIGGRTYAQLDRPMQTVGAVLEATSFHPGRTARNHLKVYARGGRIPTSRIAEVLRLVGLADAADRKVGGYSLGMRQRLALATALLGDPDVLVLDEPTNGLDPEGIQWMRQFLRAFAAEGRTVLVSSHMLSEVQQTADALLMIARGRKVFQGGFDDLLEGEEIATVVDGPDRQALAGALQQAGLTFDVLRSGLTVRGAETVTVGAAAAAAGVTLSALQRRGPSLEDVFFQLVNGERVHPSAGGTAAVVAPAATPDAEPEIATVDEVVDEREPAAEPELTLTGAVRALGLDDEQDVPAEADAGADPDAGIVVPSPATAGFRTRRRGGGPRIHWRGCRRGDGGRGRTRRRAPCRDARRGFGGRADGSVHGAR